MSNWQEEVVELHYPIRSQGGGKRREEEEKETAKLSLRKKSRSKEGGKNARHAVTKEQGGSD